MNIDKDIGAVKNIIVEYSTKKEEYPYETVPIRLDETHIKSIENVLTELETYKKIAEKLAEKLNQAYFEENDFGLFFEKEILKGIQADYGYVGEAIIDWARKEVEK